MSSIFLFDNQAVDGSVVASSEAGATMPAENVLNPQRTRVWRSGAGTESYLDLTLTGIYGVTYVALVDVNLSTAGTIRVQSWADAIGGAEPGVDETVTPTLYVNTELESSAYGEGPFGIGVYGIASALTQAGSRNITIIPLDSVSMDAYWRITLSDENTDYQQLGVLFLGQAFEFENDLAQGWGATRVDRSPTRESLGGQAYRQDRGARLRLRGTFEYATDDERSRMLKRMEYFGQSKPFIYSIFPESNNKGLTTTVYGRFEQADIANKLYDRSNLDFSVLEEF